MSFYGPQGPGTAFLPSEPTIINHLQINGRVAERQPMRYTPGGVGIIEWQLEHTSTQVEDGMPRQIQLVMLVRASGSLARDAEKLAVGDLVLVRGFLAPKRKDGKQWLLIAQEFAWQADQDGVVQA